MSHNKGTKFNFGWGNPHFLLDILENQLLYINYTPNLSDWSYGPYEGLPELIDLTKRVIKETTGNTYTHIIMTNGASSAINILLRHFKMNGGKHVYTTQYGYPSYEDMIRRADLKRIRNLDVVPFSVTKEMWQENIRLIDSPENPTGEQFVGGDAGRDIWDGVYHNKIYTRQPRLQPAHKYFVGSYSKLLGIAGARVGFIAVSDWVEYSNLLAEARNELTGISRPSQELVIKILDNLDLDAFMTKGHIDLCYNKEEFQKIEYLFDGQKVNEVGMFYCVKADDKAVAVLDRAGVEYVRLDQDTIRLSMGHTKIVTQDGIKAILKEDNG